MVRCWTIAGIAVATALICSMPGAFAQSNRAPINLPGEVFEALKNCFKPPQLERDHPGMQITVHFALKRSGELLGKPRITFESPEANDDDRLKYRIAIMQALEACTPFPLTESFGGAAAGKPFRMLFDDRRNMKRTEMIR